MLYQIKILNLLTIHIFNLFIKIICLKKGQISINSCLSIQPWSQFIPTSQSRMGRWIALLEEILVLTKANEPDYLFFNITACRSDKAYVREAYKEGAAALFHFKNMGHMIPKLFEVLNITVQVQGPAKEIEPLKEILPGSDFYEAISEF